MESYQEEQFESPEGVNMHDEIIFALLIGISIGILIIITLDSFIIEPSMLDNVCKAYGYDKAVSWTFKPWSIRQLVSLECQSISSIIKVI